MNVYLSDKFESQISKTALLLGFQQREVIERALLYYFDSLKDEFLLRSEFAAWDKLSDEAMIKFEEELEKR